MAPGARAPPAAPLLWGQGNCLKCDLPSAYLGCGKGGLILCCPSSPGRPRGGGTGLAPTGKEYGETQTQLKLKVITELSNVLRFRCGSQSCSQDSSSLHTKPPAPLPGAVASPVHPSDILAHPSAAPATHWDAPGAPSRLCWGLRWVPALRSAGMGAWGPAQQTAPHLTAGRLLSKTCLRDSNEPGTGTREEKSSPGAGAEPPPEAAAVRTGGSWGCAHRWPQSRCGRDFGRNFGRNFGRDLPSCPRAEVEQC